MHQIRYFQECALTALPGDARTAPPSYRYFIDMVERLRRLQPQDLTENSVLFGVPAQIAEVLKKVEAVGFDEVILYFNVGLKPHSQIKDEMARFMAEMGPLSPNRLERIPDCASPIQGRLGIGLESLSLTRRSDLVVGLGHWMPARLLTPYGLNILASRTANAPVRKIPSKVPAPPIEATGAPSPSILPRLRRSAPIRQPSEPLI